MEYSDIISGIRRFGADNEDICAHGLGIASEQVQENVIITPGWNPDTVQGLGKAEVLCESGPLYGFKVWNILNGSTKMTFIKTGCGSPALLDALLSLGLTRCKRILFISSVGSLDAGIGIGDIVIPEYSVCGDGASRYIGTDKLVTDVFGEKMYPDARLFKCLEDGARVVCAENNIKWHIGRAFCTDTILAQYAHIDSIMDTGCNVIDLETAAAFRAARLMKIPLAALFCVSDNTVVNKSLISGRSKEEMEYRTYVRKEIVPQMILRLIGSFVSFR